MIYSSNKTLALNGSILQLIVSRKVYIIYNRILIMVKILVLYSLVYQKLSIRCGIKGYYSNYVNLELLVYSVTG